MSEEGAKEVSEQTFTAKIDGEIVKFRLGKIARMVFSRPYNSPEPFPEAGTCGGGVLSAVYADIGFDSYVIAQRESDNLEIKKYDPMPCRCWTPVSLKRALEEQLLASC